VSQGRRGRKSRFLVPLILLLGAARADEIDDYVKGQMQKLHIPAVSLAVIRGGSPIKAQGYGLANIEHGIPARPDTVYKIGSVSKQFLATGILLLVQDGKVALDDKVSKHLTGTPDTWQAITLRHLLTHTSGLAREGPGFNPYKVQPDLDVIQTAYTLPLRFQPGEKWEYCNLGYFILAEVIHQVSGKSWSDFLAERVFAPLGMTATRATSFADIVPSRAAGYPWKADRFQNTENWPAVRPSGAFLSTALDLAKWEAALLTDDVLTRSTKAEMWTPVTLKNGKPEEYGFGWTIGEQRGHRFVAHGGGIHGFSTFIVRLIQDQLTVIVLMNGPGNSGEIAMHVAGEYLPGLTLASVKPQPDPHPALSARLKQCLFDLAEKRDSQGITAEFRENYANSRNRVRELQRRLKALQSFTFVTTEDPPRSRRDRLGVPVSRLCSYKLLSGDETRFYTFELTADDQVAWYQSSAE